MGGVVRLNPISKTDEKWNKKGDRESKSNNRVPLESSASNSPNGFNRTSIRIPAVDSVNSGTDKTAGMNYCKIGEEKTIPFAI